MSSTGRFVPEFGRTETRTVTHSPAVNGKQAFSPKRPAVLVRAHGSRIRVHTLPPGGAFIAVEALIDDARRENVFGLLMSLNMLIEFGDAFDFSGADFRQWCTEAGFTRFEVIHLTGPSSAAIAYK